ncbi:MAG: hypothetical protein ACRD1X_10220 [Vicinamibacteria bacterium]
MTFVGIAGVLSGYDPDRSRALAPRVSAHIYRTCCVLVDGRWQGCSWSGGASVPREVCYGYDRDLVKAFQDAAGYEGDDIDGIYGPATRGALIYYGVRTPPPALFGRGTTTYVPPTLPGPAVEPQPQAPPPPPEEAAPAPPVIQPRRVSWVGIVLGGAATSLVVWWIAARRRR